MEIRRIGRIGRAEYLLLSTVRIKERTGLAAARDIAEGMEILEDLLRKYLRGGDVVAKYSPSQFIILLPLCTYESAVDVAERLRKQFRGITRQPRLDLLCEIEVLSGMKQADTAQVSAKVEERKLINTGKTDDR